MERSSMDSKNYGQQGFYFLSFYHSLTYQYVTSQKYLF